MRVKISVLIVSMLFAVSAFAQQPTHPTTASAAERNIERIQREVYHQLVLLPYYSVFDNLEYQVPNENTVILKGQVTDPTLKDSAGRVVKGIEGVRSVENQIQILPPSPNDDRIRRAEFRAIYGFAPLQRYGFMAVPQIHIIVDNGHVTLEGIVDRKADKDMANIRANSVPDVFSVTNNLKVSNSGKKESKK